MPIFLSVCAVLIGAFTSLLVIAVVIRRSGRPVWGVRTKEFHQTHIAPVPRIGGLAFAITFAAIYLCCALFPTGRFALAPPDHAIFIGALAMFALGFWDDLKHLGARRKLAGQILIAASIWYWGDVRVEMIKNPAGGRILDLGELSGPITVVWIVAFTNLINIIDGIDGLAGGVGLMLLSLLAYLSGQNGASFPQLVSLGLIGAMAGFLRFNFPPAKIYMGDGGAYFLGCLISLLALKIAHKGTVFGAMIAPLLALGFPIMDTSLAVFRRALKGLPLFRSDRGHIHHRLITAGLGKTQAVLLLYALSFLFLLSALTILASHGRAVGIVFGVIFLGVLLLGRLFSFSREWTKPMTALAERYALRRHSRYALTLCAWIELEAERAPTMPALWGDFCFLCKKLGFSRVTLRFHEGRDAEYLVEGVETGQISPRLVATHSLNHFGIREIEIVAETAEMTQKKLDLVSELASEALLKALAQWQKIRNAPLHLNARVFQVENAMESTDDQRTTGSVTVLTPEEA